MSDPFSVKHMHEVDSYDLLAQLFIHAVRQFLFDSLPLPSLCIAPTSGQNLSWSNAGYSYAPGYTVPCVNGKQQWSGYEYPGLITQHPTGTENYAIKNKFKVMNS